MTKFKMPIEPMVTLTVESDEGSWTMRGKARGVSTTYDNEYGEFHHGYGSSMERLSESSNTNIEWTYGEDGYMYTITDNIKGTLKEAGPVEKVNTIRVELLSLDEERYEARDGEELSFDIGTNNVVYIYATTWEYGKQKRTLVKVVNDGWVSVSYDRI